MKRLGGKILRKNRDLRFNNNTTALIFGSFDQAKEQRSHFKRHSNNCFYFYKTVAKPLTHILMIKNDELLKLLYC